MIIIFISHLKGTDPGPLEWYFIDKRMDGKMNMKFSTSMLQTGDLVESLQTDDLRPAMGTILAIQRDKTGNSTLDTYLVQVGENLIGVTLHPNWFTSNRRSMTRCSNNWFPDPAL